MDEIIWLGDENREIKKTRGKNIKNNNSLSMHLDDSTGENSKYYSNIQMPLFKASPVTST